MLGKLEFARKSEFAHNLDLRKKRTARGIVGIIICQEHKMTVISLLTDFGLRDGYVGVMKGVMLRIAPQVQFADISHHISPQNMLQGALALGRTAPYFPDGTIHLAVVDPGVGTSRRPIAGQVGGQFFVGPDNGLFSILIQRAQQAGDRVQIVHLTQPRYWLPEISRVFHGRDIFAPAAAHLAKGVRLADLGETVDDPVLLDIPQPRPVPGGGWAGQVVEVDYFGNLSANIERRHLAGLGAFRVRIGEVTVEQWVNTFGERPAGSLVALYGTADDLVISVVNGSAAAQLGLGVGALVEIIPVGEARHP